MILFTESKPLRESKALYRDLSARIIADSGMASNPFLPQVFIREMAKRGFLDFCVDHVVLNLPELRKMDGSNEAKMYNVFKGAHFDAFQDVGSAQPTIGTGRNGRIAFLYTDGRRLVFAGDGLDFMRQVNFDYAGAVTDMTNAGGIVKRLYTIHTPSTTTIRLRMGNSGSNQPIMQARRTDAESVNNLQVNAPASVYRLESVMVDYTTGRGDIIRNGTSIGNNPSLVTIGPTDNTASSGIVLGAELSGLNPSSANIAAFIMINAQPPTGFMDVLNGLILSEYNLPV